MDTIATLSGIVQILCQHPDISNPESPVCLAYKTAQAAIKGEAMKKESSINITWTDEDVQSVRPDLNEHEARQVLSFLVDKHDANIGINWETIEAAAETLFGEEKEVPDKFEDFLSTYKPIRNGLAPNASFGGRIFETFGSEYEAVRQAHEIDSRCIWTLLDCDGAEVIASGWHFVNRMGYFICTVPFEGEFCEIVLSDSADEDAVEEELEAA